MKLLLFGLCSLSIMTSHAQGVEKRIQFLVQELSVSNSPQIELMAIWDDLFSKNGPQSNIEMRERLSRIQGLQLPNDTYRLRLIVAKSALKIPLKSSDYPQGDWSRETGLSYLSLRENYDQFLPIKMPKSFGTLIEEFEMAKQKDQWSRFDLKSLLSFSPRLGWGFRNYKRKPIVYLLCRHNREYPCLMMMKDRKGKWVRNSNGRVWSQPKLAMSSRGLAAHQVNGQTPQGIFTIDSVMPSADQNEVFGKYRRLKLDFVGPSSKEKDLLRFIPKSLRHYSWWRENIIARDIGRKYLRIHGTGTINDDPASTWYPFYPTAGCIASRENSYDGVNYNDQQLLLNVMMKSSGLKVSYGNETKLEGLLYVVNIDDQEAPVEINEIAPLL